jgi:enamine deaminase RidA (YjgF/YER057c/UK114 family)
MESRVAEGSMSGSVEKKLASLGISLPTPATPIANYVPFVRSGNLLVVSGQLCFGADGNLVNSTPGFTDGPKVMNGASDLMVEVFGEKGRHARSTVGVAALPANAAVEVEGQFEVS